MAVDWLVDCESACEKSIAKTEEQQIPKYKRNNTIDILLRHIPIVFLLGLLNISQLII
jgi:hypothetical protein